MFKNALNENTSLLFKRNLSPGVSYVSSYKRSWGKEFGEFVFVEFLYWLNLRILYNHIIKGHSLISTSSEPMLHKEKWGSIEKGILSNKTF